MLSAGYFASADTVSFYIKPIQWVSAFKYCYQTLATIQFSEMQPLNCYNQVDNPIIDCDPLNGILKFEQDFNLSLILLGCVFVGLISLALISLLIKGRRT